MPLIIQWLRVKYFSFRDFVQREKKIDVIHHKADSLELPVKYLFISLSAMVIGVILYTNFSGDEWIFPGGFGSIINIVLFALFLTLFISALRRPKEYDIIVYRTGFSKLKIFTGWSQVDRIENGADHVSVIFKPLYKVLIFRSRQRMLNICPEPKELLKTVHKLKTVLELYNKHYN
ncbi:MAG: hypothetical protein KKF44_01800 [Nanoarchaeota archaeon]|nr:hypothetical protein [Nanoarchaeota archaeon]